MIEIPNRLFRPLLICLWIIAPTLAAADVPTWLDDLSAAQRPMADLPGTGGTDGLSDITASMDAGLEVSSSVDRPDGVYFVGDRIVISVRVNRDAYITVLTTGPDGTVYQLFPNGASRDNRLTAGETRQIPRESADYDLLAGEPPGTDVITVLASTQPGRLYGITATKPIGPYREFLKTGGDAAREVRDSLQKKHARSWNMSASKIVVRRQ